MAREMSRSKNPRKARPYIAGLWVLIIGCVVWGAGAYLSRFWLPSNKIGLSIFSGLLVVSISYLADIGRSSQNLFLADICRWIGESKGRNFLLAGLFAFYILFLHPYITGKFSSAPFIEWGVVCFILWRLYESMKSRLEELYSSPLMLSSWERHAQKLAKRGDERISRLSAIQAEFVEEGIKERLLRYLVQLLKESGWPEVRIQEILLPLSAYQEEKVPWFAFGRQKKRLKYKNLRTRQEILEGIMYQIGEEKSEGVIHEPGGFARSTANL